MEKEDTGGYENIYSNKMRAGRRRTYFFDVKKTKSDDYYVSITESTKKFNSTGYERHKIFLYKEDFHKFISELQATIDYVKTNLMPDFDYDAVEKRQAEWEASKKSSEEDKESENPERSDSDDKIDW